MIYERNGMKGFSLEDYSMQFTGYGHSTSAHCRYIPFRAISLGGVLDTSKGFLVLPWHPPLPDHKTLAQVRLANGLVRWSWSVNAYIGFGCTRFDQGAIDSFCAVPWMLELFQDSFSIYGHSRTRTFFGWRNNNIPPCPTA